MIRQPKNEESCTINVFLKDGTSYLNKDITEKPISENEMLVGFWHEEKVRTYPMEQVYFIEFCFNE
jgi:hypothetical protein